MTSGHHVESTTLHVTAHAQSSLAFHSLCGLRLATASISSFLAITWRQCSFLPWLQRSKQGQLTLYLFSLLYLSPLENLYWFGAQEIYPHNRESMAGRREAMRASGWVNRPYTERRILAKPQIACAASTSQRHAKNSPAIFLTLLSVISLPPKQSLWPSYRTSAKRWADSHTFANFLSPCNDIWKTPR